MAQIINNKSKALDKPPTFLMGEHDFVSHMSGSAAYVDKTRFIQRWWDSGAKVTLIVRPRRFTKTTVLDMTNSYFDPIKKGWFKELDINNLASPELLSARDHCDSILLSFKDIDASTLFGLATGLRNCFSTLFMRYQKQFVQFKLIYGEIPMQPNPSTTTTTIKQFIQSLTSLVTAFLEYMHLTEEKKFIILVDEYDRVLETADATKDREHFDQVLLIYSQILSALFKDKSYLEKALLTGVLPLAANSILSSFNNAIRDSFLQSKYNDIFGFTYEEVNILTGSWMSDDDKDRMFSLIDFYNSGNKEILNPWSVMTFIESVKRGEPSTSNTWVTTGKSEWIQYYNDLSSEDIKNVSLLLTGDSVSTKLNDAIGYSDRVDNFSNFLTYAFYTGYLTYTESTGEFVSLRVPNKEVEAAWIHNLKLLVRIGKRIDWSEILNHLDSTDESCGRLSRVLHDMFDESASYMDLKGENSYHMWVLGLMCSLSHKYVVRSNREAGRGRFDIALTPLDGPLRNYVFELKESSKATNLERDADIAIAQVKDNRYYRFFENKNDIVIIGLSAYKKDFCAKVEIYTREELVEYYERKAQEDRNQAYKKEQLQRMDMDLR
ncbi:AAA family ATPase [Paenibacillus sp. YYML68]|uniref:AAA family ATPase n=1 Tax=Paenibacillus sp. YYML68 TaxID=2909250 RepID=UPI002491376B|nr:AAA family ATPase [Paenibacillus sp. YYML68]